MASSITGGAAGVAGSVSVESQLVTLLDKLESIRQDTRTPPRPPMIAEVRTLELWRAVIAECLATVFFVFLVCGAYSPWSVGKTLTQKEYLTVAVVAGLAMAVLIHSFGQVSGGHINPAVTVSLAVTRRVSPLRASMFVLAQLGGGIAGAALLYGATSSGYGGDLGATTVSPNITPWQGLGLEFLLTFVVVFVYFASVNPYRRNFGNPAIAVGLAYMACSLVGLPLTGASMNPARSLGPAFVKNKWDSHWVYWVGPLLGGTTAGLIYEYIFNPNRLPRSRKESMDGGDSSSVGSDEDPYDECSKPPPRYNYNALRAQNFNQYRPANTSNTTSPLGYPASIYDGPSDTQTVCNAAAYKYDSGYSCTTNKDDIYSGSKSLYARSPPLPRSSSLNRSQSVYTKPPPPRIDNYSRNISHSQNYCNKSPSGFTVVSHNTDGMYKGPPRQDSLYVTGKAIVKPEPVYGTSAYGKQTDSGDSSYSTYRGSTGYSSSRSSNPGLPLPMTRTRSDNHTPNSVMSAHSTLVTPNSAGMCYSPNPQY